MPDTMVDTYIITMMAIMAKIQCRTQKWIIHVSRPHSELRLRDTKASCQKVSEL